MVRLSVAGMTCPLCVTAVNQALRTTPGVISAKTNLNNEQADVVVPDDFDLQHLLAAVQKAGYEAEIMSTAQESAPSDANHPATTKEPATTSGSATTKGSTATNGSANTSKPVPAPKAP